MLWIAGSRDHLGIILEGEIDSILGASMMTLRQERIMVYLRHLERMDFARTWRYHRGNQGSGAERHYKPEKDLDLYSEETESYWIFCMEVTWWNLKISLWLHCGKDGLERSKSEHKKAILGISQWSRWEVIIAGTRMVAVGKILQIYNSRTWWIMRWGDRGAGWKRWGKWWCQVHPLRK